MATSEEVIDAEVCRNIALILKESGMTQTQFGAKCGVGQKTVNHVVNRKQNPRIDFVKAIIREFEVSSKWLLFTKGDKYERDEPKTNIINDINELKTHILSLEKHRKFTDNLVKKLYDEVKNK